MDNALIRKIIIHFEFSTIIWPKAFDFCFELSLNKLKEGFDNRNSLWFILHQMNPSKPWIIIHNCQEKTRTIYWLGDQRTPISQCMRLKGEFETEMLMGKGSLCCFAIGQIRHIVFGLHEISRINACNKLILEVEGCLSL